jgi:hypothetical protein
LICVLTKPSVSAAGSSAVLRAPIAICASLADCKSARPNTPPPPLVVDPLGPALPLQPPMPIAPMIQSSFFMVPPRTWG